ncbi:TonB-dependent receptor domain-containing protein [Flavobacterium sp. XGLA_31]|uniref:TonB-dependent receptor n=1 Tax=Flavobacterium sp. XGLA_31 TaxID=3447666 RepID=UPI003F2B9582
MKLKLQFINCLTLFFFTLFLHAQTSGIKGVVIEDKTGQPLPGATVTIKGLNKSRVTGADGTFSFSKIEPGTYELSVTALSFQEKDITEVIVVKDEITMLTISLEEKNNQLDEVVIKTTRAKVESVKSLLTQQKNSANVSDGISAETIKRTPDKNTSDVLKRISGASIQDNRFVIVRGLNDRYNAAFLNGAPLPSSEPDRKAFSFDIFPSNMLDNLVIAKTASPDLPGDFAGGVIQINTKAVPDKDFQSVTVGSGYNTITTFKNQKTYEKGATDWLGFDDGTRAMPSTIPSTEVFNTLTYQEKAAIAKSFQSDWAIKDGSFKPNTSFQYSIGKHFEFNDKVFGMLFSISNNKTNTFNETERNDYDNPDPSAPSVLISKFTDNNYSEQVLTGALANFSFKFNENHTLTLKNIYSINSTDLVVERTGQRDVNDTRVIDANVRWFTSNKIYSGQLNGDHYFPKAKIKVNWTGFFSNIKREIPNLRRNIYSTANPNSTDPTETIAYAEIANNNGGPDYGGGMFFSENKETIKGGKLDISRKFNIGEEFSNEIKIGGFLQNRDRDFFSRQLQYNTLTLGGNFDYNLLTLPDAAIFSVANMGQISPGVNGFTLFDFTKFTDSYSAGSKLNAGYVMLDNRYKKWRLVWGFRLEDYTQTLASRLTETNYLALDAHQTDFLPSANLIFAVNKKQNLRFSFSRTLNRPEFRELAPFGFYDFTTQFFTQGNPDLKIAKVRNIDVRYEFYPGKGQLFSVSYFNKYFTDPIEIQQEVNNKTITYRNAKSATNTGFEFEFRTLLSSLFSSDTTTLLDDLTLFSNIAIIKSNVDVSNFNSASTEKSRPLQGQSPYVLNAGLQYANKDNGWSVSTNLNRVGNRIAFASSEIKPAIWEKARTLLDVQIAKNFYKNKLELKLNIQNILAQDLIFYQNNYRDGQENQGSSLTNLTNLIFTGDSLNEDGYDSATDDVIWRTKYGRTFSLSLTYNF